MLFQFTIFFFYLIPAQMVLFIRSINSVLDIYQSHFSYFFNNHSLLSEKVYLRFLNRFAILILFRYNKTNL